MVDNYPIGISAPHIAQVCGVSQRTVLRWKAARRVPAVFALGIALLVDGDLGVISSEWRGWKLTRGELVSPENWRFRPGEIISIPLRQQLQGELQRALGRPLQRELL